MQDFEKLGAFYLGKEFDQAAGKLTDNLILYLSLIHISEPTRPY